MCLLTNMRKLCVPWTIIWNKNKMCLVCNIMQSNNPKGIMKYLWFTEFVLFWCVMFMMLRHDDVYNCPNLSINSCSWRSLVDAEDSFYYGEDIEYRMWLIVNNEENRSFTVKPHEIGKTFMIYFFRVTWQNWSIHKFFLEHKLCHSAQKANLVPSLYQVGALASAWYQVDNKLMPNLNFIPSWYQVYSELIPS